MPGMRAEGVSFSDQHEMRAAILRPCRLTVSSVEGTLFAVADGADAARVHAEGDEVLLRGVGALVAEREVVLLGAALVAVAFDEHVVLFPVALQPRRRRAQRRLRLGRQRRFVEAEEGVL